jgi:hypothetical protein
MKYFVIILFTACLFVAPSNAQERKLIYDVVRNGNVIGQINFTQKVQGQKVFLSLTSDVKTTLIFQVTDHTAETAVYDKGVMVYSSFYQKQSGSDEVNKTTTVSGKMYKITDNGASKLVNFGAIRYNMLLLYTIPKNMTKVYSSNFQKLADIKKIEENKYRLTLPDGNVNDYTYKNGVCTKVEVVRTMISVQFILREK